LIASRRVLANRDAINGSILKEVVMAKKKQKATVEAEAPATRNHAAAALADARFRKQVVADQKKYRPANRKADKAKLKQLAAAA
jgi:hypothetical protein